MDLKYHTLTLFFDGNGYWKHWNSICSFFDDVHYELFKI
jgi:hypothetical protein